MCSILTFGEWYIFQWQMEQILHIFGLDFINIQIFAMHFTYICSEISYLSEKTENPRKTHTS